MIKVYAMA